jgi:hypothetical protein
MMSMELSLNTSALVTADSRKGQRATETFRAQYNKAGLDNDGAQRLNEHPGFAAYLLAGIRRFSAEEPDYKLARTILGKDFVSTEDIMKSRKGVVYTDDQLSQFGDTVPSQEVLQWCYDNGYMLIAGPNRPMSLLEVRDLKRDYFYSKESGWHAEHKFTLNDKVDTRWIMFRKEPVPGSTSKNWSEQQALLSETEVTLNAAEVAWCVTTYKAVRGIYLLDDLYVRTSSLGSDGVRVSVGGFDAEGLSVDSWYDSVRYDPLGVSAGRKF